MDAKQFEEKYIPAITGLSISGFLTDLTSLIQEESIEFTEWIRKNGYTPFRGHNMEDGWSKYIQGKDEKSYIFVFKTTSELYNSKEYQEYRKTK